MEDIKLEKRHKIQFHCPLLWEIYLGFLALIQANWHHWWVLLGCCLVVGPAPVVDELLAIPLIAVCEVEGLSLIGCCSADLSACFVESLSFSSLEVSCIFDNISLVF